MFFSKKVNNMLKESIGVYKTSQFNVLVIYF